MPDKIDFGAPIAVTEMPPPSSRGGRAAVTPALEAWIMALSPGTWELASKDPDGAHPVARVTQLRKVSEPHEDVSIETRAVTAGKRYRIFATKNAPAEEATNGDAGTKAKGK